ncbi:isoflavone reductase family protein [Metarhizium album ARSEF 1941]|uniref:Isoflavone reductase family protein n=1 Tax=Metarhizium album (strain ARSEF 1941) TaxID=1081103 RepID=A0A0B2WXB2_METAS|nr:isoflavone reductase family protein [Metarhizium album ARSEF 1941]KHN97510.1 isoflavone reductase family protein [Metarhizium album ARSEF 1941]
MTLRTVAIAGATGNLGGKVTRAFLRPENGARFRDVVALVRAESNATAGLAAAGAKLRVYDEDNLAESLQGVDVLISPREKLLRCLSSTSVSLYFPSEFGVNHYLHDFAHDEWDMKKRHFELAKQLIPDIRLCRVYAGLLLEDSVGPWFGFDTKRGRYEAVGSPSQRTSYTSKSDVGRALANLASLPAGEVPAEVYLSGDSKSFQEIADIMKAHGAGDVDVTSVPLAPYKAEVLTNPSPTPERYLRFLMGEGKIDHSEQGLGSQTDVVLRGGPIEWTQVKDLAAETGGKPWADSDW